ncbi:MAG: alpha/beta hydrolase [Lachnospiraceae bacterium]|nr:alpha/beta hydrolase [Lachnospiraceae bacterium]
MKFTTDVKMLPIWGDVIPGNTGEDKRTVMHPDLNMTMQDIFSSKGGIWDKSSDEITETVADDTLVWKEEIENGYAKETFDDVPFLVPYLVEGSKKCVISCPGGAYLSKSVEGEGSDIAAFLNANGISCFVLWYRTQPYRMPLMFMDLQRAIRYVRYHANDFGIDPNQIATVGFSAGGNLNGVTGICFGNKPVDYPGYVPDEIDAVDACANAIGMCYPAVSMEHDKALSVLIGIDQYNDKAKRKQLADEIDMVKNLHKDVPPMFLCCCQDDDVVPPVNLARLNTKAVELGIPTEYHMFPSGGHGFGGCVVRPTPFGIPNYDAVEAWKDLFVRWLNRVFV